MLKDRHDKQKPMRLPRQPQLPALEQLRQMHQECVKHPGAVSELPFGDTYMLTACRQPGSNGCDWKLYQQQGGESFVEITFDANDPRWVHQQIIDYFPRWSNAPRRTNEQPMPSSSGLTSSQQQTPAAKHTPLPAAGQRKYETPEPVMEGDLSVLKLSALLRSMGREQLTGHLHVRSGMNDAYIYVVDGEAVHCVFSDYEGPDAFRAVAALPAGKFFFYKGPRCERHTLPKDLDGLLKSPMALPPQKSHGKSGAKGGTFQALGSGTTLPSTGTVKTPATSSSDNLPKNPHANENPLELLGQSSKEFPSSQNAVPPPAMRNPNQSDEPYQFEFQKPSDFEEPDQGDSNQFDSNQSVPPRAQPLTPSPGIPPSSKPFNPELPLADQLRKRLTWSNMVPPTIGPAKPITPQPKGKDKPVETEPPHLIDLLGTLPENPARAPRASLAELGVPENLLSEDFKQQLRSGEHPQYVAPEQPDSWADTGLRLKPEEAAHGEPQAQPDQLPHSEPQAQRDQPNMLLQPEPHYQPELSVPPEPFHQPDMPLPQEPGHQPDMPVPPEPFHQPAMPVPSEPFYPPDVPVPPEPGHQPDMPVPPEPGHQPDMPVPPEPGHQPDMPVPREPGHQPDMPVPPEPGHQPDMPVPREPGHQPDMPVPPEPFYPPDMPVPPEPFYPPDMPVPSEPFYPPDVPVPPEPFQLRDVSEPPHQPTDAALPQLYPDGLPQPGPHPPEQQSQPRMSFYSEIPQPLPIEPTSEPAQSTHIEPMPHFALPPQFPGFLAAPAESSNAPKSESNIEIPLADLTWSDPTQGFAPSAPAEQTTAPPSPAASGPTPESPAEPLDPPAPPPAPAPFTKPALNPFALSSFALNPFAPPPTPPPPVSTPMMQTAPMPEPPPAPPPALSLPNSETDTATAPPSTPPPTPFFPPAETAIKPPESPPAAKPIHDIAARLAARLAAQATPTESTPRPEALPDFAAQPTEWALPAEPAKPPNDAATVPPRAIYRPIPDFAPKAAEPPVAHDAPAEPVVPRAVYRPIPDFPAKKTEPAAPPTVDGSSREADWTSSKSKGSGPILDFGKPTDFFDFPTSASEAPSNPVPTANPPTQSSTDPPTTASVSPSDPGSQNSLFGPMPANFLTEEGEALDAQTEPELDPIFGHTPPPMPAPEPSLTHPAAKKEKPSTESTLILPALKQEKPAGREQTLILPALKKEVAQREHAATAESTLILPAMKPDVSQPNTAAAETNLILPATTHDVSQAEIAGTSEPTLILPANARSSQTGMPPASHEPNLILPALANHLGPASKAPDHALAQSTNASAEAPAVEALATGAELTTEQPQASPKPVKGEQTESPDETIDRVQPKIQAPPLSGTAALIARAASKAAASRSAAARLNPFENLSSGESGDQEPPVELASELLVDELQLADPLFGLAPKAPPPPPPPPPEVKPAQYSNPWLNLQQSRAKSRAEIEAAPAKPSGADPSRTLSLEEKGIRGFSKADRQQVRSGLVNRETQIYTFPALMYFMELEFVRAMRYNRFFALLVMQVGYKSAKGGGSSRVQPLASDALALLSTKIMDIKRAPDLLGHFDPAGLAIFMPDTDRSVANHFATRLAEMISQIEPAPWTDFNPLEFMIGVAGAPEDAHDLESLIKEAVKYPVRHILP